MKIIRVDRDRYFNEKETPINVEGTDEQCFEKFYAFNRTYKYCNDVYFKSSNPDCVKYISLALSVIIINSFLINA